ISRDRHQEALVLLDRVKTINDASLVENPLVKSSVLSEEELAMERQISEEMDQIRKQFFNASADEQQTLQNELESLSAQKQELNRNLNVTHSQEPPKIWKIQRSLKPGQQILHITVLEENYYLSHISTNSVEVKKLHLSAETVTHFENAVASVVRGRTNLDALYQAGRFINIQGLPDNTRSVLVIPDGFFHQIPLDIIPLKKPDSPSSYGSARYVIEQMDVRHLNSLNDLIQPVRHAPASYTFDYTGFGISDFQNESRDRRLVSLPQAPVEVRNISENLNRLDVKNSFINETATPRQFRQSAGRSRILHLATHSEVSESDPLFSRLHLSADSGLQPGDEPSDHLFAYELFDLNMQNQLIMLNSCESGGDRFLQGSGIMGISRALRYAGAHSLILNAWSVNDQFAADFAEKFYQHLNEGESKSRALQLTKIYFIKQKNANPHYWGPYVLNGDNRPLLTRAENQTGVFVLAGLFLTGFILLRRDTATQKKKTAA
ncbi:MAG: CHAT domain-containing protein, partial [Balneolaceae bacterium]